MDDPLFKTKYQKYKYKVKLWEKQFTAKNGRVPSKHDIREAPSLIRDSYKMYYKLKTSFLEETLSEALEDDAFDLSLLDSSSQTETCLSASLLDISTPDLTRFTNDSSEIQLNSTDQSEIVTNLNATTSVTDSLDSLCQSQNVSQFTDCEVSKFDSLNENAWGQELNRTISTPVNQSDEKNYADAGVKLRKTMSDRLFRNSSFSKRNPRKSLSKSSLTSSLSSHSLGTNSQREILPDLETILSQKSIQAKENDASAGTTDQVGTSANAKSINSNLVNNIDQEWLSRCNQTNSLNLNSLDEKQTSLQNGSTKQSYGLSNINANALSDYDAASLSSSANRKSMLSFDMNHLNLKQSQSLTPTSANNVDDDEEIANSEDETDKTNTPQIRSIRHSLSKRKHCDIDKSMAPIERISKRSEIEVKTESNETVNINKNKTKVERNITKNKLTKKSKATVQNAPATQRRSSRNSKINVDYSQPKQSDSDIENVEDPFACDDSDADPDFSTDKKSSSKNCDSDSNESTASESTEKRSDESDKKTKRKVVKVIRKRVVKGTQPKIQTTQIRKVRKIIPKKRKSDAKKDENNENDIDTEETPDDYLMEFGIDKIKLVPRIGISELEQTTQKFSEYVNNSMATNEMISAKKVPTTSKPLVTKNSLARDKLEKKIAAGKVNENFVRINLRKKVFVRGKKTINFSRYKKTMWRNKKAAALTGPEMDMRGCDGGILMCFQCGLPGHFAQNCKIKSDRLLPLSADVEESPFPTLQEVEDMSKQKILLAHGGRELPETDNPTWKTNDEQEIDMKDSTEGQSNTECNELVDYDGKVDIVETPTYIGHQIPEDFLIKAGLLNDDSNGDKQVKPLYDLKDDGTLQDTPDEVFEALKMFGHENFRSGQEKAVMRILSGYSTLVTLSTGSGKSLCYQLPAYLYSKKKKCITLVVSPLVSLMEDQVHGVPHFLNAQCLHTNQSKARRDIIMDMIKSGDVHVLLISPEAIVAGEKSTGFGSILRDLPPIAFVCIDEAHCVSQWSHNFRPSYLMVCRVLHEKLKVKTVLGLTATATVATRQSIVRHLMIHDGLSGVISDIPLPDNLTLSISCDANRDHALVRLLKEEKFANFQSIIIYCSRRDECERVAKNLRTYFQENIANELQQRNATGKRKRSLKTTIEPYHAGIAASRRRTIQNAFMRGDLKIVVATIAFGMGINKADIRSVIHYNMPMNFESYVQEVGRSGRDGERAHCHLFLDSMGGDKLELRRHIYANSIDRHIIRKLLRKIFVPCACKRPDVKQKCDDNLQNDLDAVQTICWDDEFNENEKIAKQRICPGHEVCFSVDETVTELDIPEENISTLLCYLELHEQRYIKALSKAYTRCKVFSYGGPKALKNAALNCPPLAMAIALDLKKGISHDTSTFIEFPVIEIASAIGWNSGVVKYQLKNLEWTNVDGLPKRSTISVEYLDLGFRVLAPGDLTDSELDSTLDLLYSRVKGQESNQLSQLENVFQGLSSVSVKSCLIAARAESNDERSEKLKGLIRNYFQSNEKHADGFVEKELPDQEASTDGHVISDIRTMITQYPENSFTGRALARIFHGVQSPVYPAVIWSRCKYWRAHIKTEFNHIVKLANMEIIRIRT